MTEKEDGCKIRASVLFFPSPGFSGSSEDVLSDLRISGRWGRRRLRRRSGRPGPQQGHCLFSWFFSFPQHTTGQYIPPVTKKVTDFLDSGKKIG